jgi:biofilm protein TabA
MAMVYLPWTMDQIKVMILDTLANAATYYGMHKNFKVAFDYINSHDLLAMEIGKYEVADGVFVMISDKETVTSEVAVSKFECHNKNIDIQLCIRGDETMGWKARHDCHNVKTEYSDEKDVLFFNETPTTFFDLKPGQFTIFYPNDVHAAMIGDGTPVKKLVVKVRVD